MKKELSSVTNGSILVMIMLIMTVVVILATQVVLSTNFMTDIARARVESEQQYRTAEGLLNYGIAVCMRNYHMLVAAKKTGKKKIESVMEQMPGAPGHTYKGVLTFMLGSKSIQVKGTLLHNNVPLYQVSCTLMSERKQSTNWIIDDWNIYKPK